MPESSRSSPADACDLVVVGAGAAGMMCAAVAAQRGRRVVLIEHARRIGEKIRISGGGRCNFTNVSTGPRHYVGRDPGFAAQALGAYTPRDFVALVRRHRIAFHEKHRGQLFCDHASSAIVDMLRAECERGGVRWLHPCRVHALRPGPRGFELDTDAGALRSARVVVATGGLPVAAIGATDWALRLARSLGLDVEPPRPALVPLRFVAEDFAPFAQLAGVALQVRASCEGASFDEDLLFTHRGLSGPAVLQVSSYWEPGRDLRFDLGCGTDLAGLLRQAQQGSRQSLLGVLAQRLPRRLAQAWLDQQGLDGARRVAETGRAALERLAGALSAWSPRVAGTEGWNKAEVMRGGVATHELDPRSLEARRVPGLHFIGEAVDITGWLGGYNFQWAWASAQAAARSV
ncbi:MAG: aminoacetone oxidase family FAD-binding enzyme [Betaproteobacteria bacterium]|nr:aminoacetone oxidase family FAD-binding enzyme [Betaproteobacteria bacterium]MDE1955440.1 aminoacetone oxidase family FAD-binding enzyme [Betaproteobacteria bacterium]MDE2153437.1 aminoacetone oxidase family FAD-binding enzyme [Betaproteobacteria bacterium]MDE2478829.1 aminoacetone oxidase family FAD-binding enzyme [Betaproteobacteria bacterium]